MSNKKRSLIILGIIFGTPVVGLLLGMLGKAIFATQDTSGLAQGFGFYIGVIGSVGSLICGPIVSFLTRNSQKQLYSLLGYIVPSSFALLYITYMMLIYPIINPV